METSDQEISTTQKKIGLLLIFIFIGLIGYYLNSQFSLLSYLTGTSSRSVKATVEPNFDVTVYCDLTSRDCRDTVQTLTNLQIEHSHEMTLNYRHNIDTNQTNSMAASIATEIARRNSKFWEMLLMLYEYQYEWVESESVVSTLADYAESVGIKRNKFISRLESSLDHQTSYTRTITKDLAEVTENNFLHEPVVVINGNVYDQKVTYTLFEPSEETAQDEEIPFEETIESEE